MKENGPWADIGITDETRILDLVFDPHSGSLVAKCGRLVAENVGIKSLYLRGIHETTYRRISAAIGNLSYEDAVLTPNGPYLFANIVEITIGASGASGDWHSLQKIELPSGQIVLEINRDELEPRLPGHRAWISGIVGVSNDGQTVFCKIGIQQGAGRVHYHLASLYPAQKRYELITELTRVFL